MKSISASLVSLALVGAACAQITLNTPNPPTVCVPVQITWSGGTPPFFLAINPGGQTGAAALQQYSGLTSSPFTWPTNITAGTLIGFQLTDSTGATGQTAPVTIQNGPDTSCLNGGSTGTSASGSTDSATTSGSATGAPATSATGATGATSATSGASTAPASSAASTSGSKSATGTSASTSATATGGSNGAIGNVASVGIVGVLGAVAAALLA